MSVDPPLRMGGSVSQVFQSGSALLSNGHGHKVSDSTRQKVQTIFDALRANPKIGVQRLEGLLQQIPKVSLKTPNYCHKLTLYSTTEWEYFGDTWWSGL